MSAKIAQALHEVMTKVGYVQKTGRNAFHGYKYAGEADLLEKLRPAMIEAGLLLLPSVRHVSECDVHGNVTVQVDYTLAHKDGDVWPHPLTAAGCGNDRSNKGTVGDKGVYKAITGANKYLLFKLFQIETGDDPESTEAPEPAPTTPPVDKQVADDLIRSLKRCSTADAIAAFKGLEDFKLAWRDLPTPQRNRVAEAAKTRLAEIESGADNLRAG